MKHIEENYIFELETNVLERIDRKKYNIEYLLRFKDKIYLITDFQTMVDLYSAYFSDILKYDVQEIKMGEIGKTRFLNNILKDYPELYLKFIDKEFVYFKVKEL